MTNSEKLRQMNDSNLAAWLHEYMDCMNCVLQDEYDDCSKNCTAALLKWLKSEAEE